MLEPLTTSNTLLAYAGSKAWNTPEMAAWLQSLAKSGQAVVLKDGANRHLFVPDGRTAQSVWSDVLTEAKAKGI